MNNNDVFPILTLHFAITILFFLIVVPVSHCQDKDDDYHFLECSSSYTYGCGSRKLNISYPFWGGDRPQYCGREGFEIKCQNNEYHSIEFENQKFRVLSMSESHPTMTIARDDLWNNCCPRKETQDTAMLDPYLFKYSLNVRILSFFHCQEIYPQYPDHFNCSAEGEDITGFYNVSVPDLPPPIPNTCQVGIKVPVLLSALDDLNRTKNLGDALNKGFEVEYLLGSTPPCSSCNSAGGICGSNQSALGQFLCYCRDDQPHGTVICGPNESPPPGNQKANVKLKVGIGFAAAFVGMAAMGIFSFWYCRRYKNKNAPSSYTSRNISSDRSSMADLEKADKLLGVQVFSYTELEDATNNFDSAKELGDGGFGTVYYGKLQDGRAVAVKRLYENNYKRVEQFMNEVEILAHLRHQNLVTLYGCTSRHSRELLLVYEYISNGTVADHLHGELTKPGALPWATRLNIAVETASALKYLHASDIIHRDVKTNNILLDNNFCVKVADFGLSRLFPTHVTHISTAPQGTPGYVDPEYHQCYQLTDKSDVFSFGVVLVELMSSMPAVDITRHRHEINLSNLAINKIQNKALHELVDPSLGFESDYKVRKMIYSVAELAFQCLQSDKDLRPCMATVLDTLKDIQSDGYSKEKVEELDITDDVGLLKHGPPTPSPDSRTSRKTTPPTSN
ncbi:hypothetical protein Ddye_015425 [Dipteronia dyeriana]|uniref:non-specific serine/threonine protein kinase n=1 Tax=Dipteronia dyeriana TaxID=168575 RepID=A0AAD9U4U7_9ROSI|nr:hypothetical protein Ddye_015425 [Dipteronia dyeriana]